MYIPTLALRCTCFPRFFCDGRSALRNSLLLFLVVWGRWRLLLGLERLSSRIFLGAKLVRVHTSTFIPCDRGAEGVLFFRFLVFSLLSHPVLGMHTTRISSPRLAEFRCYLVSCCCFPGVLTGATKAQNAKIAGKFDGHLRLSEGLNVTSSGEAKGVRKHQIQKQCTTCITHTSKLYATGRSSCRRNNNYVREDRGPTEPT